jgi:hypothetical protein
MTGPRVHLARFIEVTELLEQAYTGPAPTPDYLAHECGLAEDALARLGAKRGSTGDAVLARLFALTLLAD